jgi:hypothetical protein
MRQDVASIFNPNTPAPTFEARSAFRLRARKNPVVVVGRDQKA